MGKFLNLFKPIFLLLLGINLLNCFVPEIGFDALWYHLTLPKLYLSSQRYFFPGGLLYYSAMPRLAETLFIPLIKYLGFIGPKLFQFTAGLLICYLLFKNTKKLNLNPLFSWLAVCLFYSIWLISWESSSGYVDLIRGAFEYTSIYLAIYGNPYLAGIFIGLALGVKWQALVGLLAVLALTKGRAIITALPIFLPWMLIAKHFTGNYFYPINEPFMIAAQIAQVGQNYYQFTQIIQRLLTAPVFLTYPTQDFLSPLAGVFLISSLVCLFSSIKSIRKLSFVAIYAVGALLLTPPPTTRFLIPYLPLLVLSFVYLTSKLNQKFQNRFLLISLLSCLLILVGRSLVLYRNLPYLMGKETVSQYLTKRAYKLPGAFIDPDSYMKNLSPDKNYLIDNLHNLYYFPYAFDHTSWADPKNHYDYLITTGVNKNSAPGIILHTNELGIQFIKL